MAWPWRRAARRCPRGRRPRRGPGPAALSAGSALGGMQSVAAQWMALASPVLEGVGLCLLVPCNRCCLERTADGRVASALEAHMRCVWRVFVLHRPRLRVKPRPKARIRQPDHGYLIKTTPLLHGRRHRRHCHYVPRAAIYTPLSAIYTPLSAPIKTPLSAAIKTPLSAATYTPLSAAIYTPLSAAIYTPLSAATYTPLSAAIYTPLSAAIYTPLSAAIYTPLSRSRARS
jgi:hypothetical protein